MGIMFLTDRDDAFLKSLHTYLSDYCECEYRVGEGDADLLVTNCLTPFPKKTVYYATEPGDYSGTDTRRIKLPFFQAAKAIMCPSLYLARIFFDRYRIRCDVQSPYIRPDGINYHYISYHPKFLGSHSITDTELAEETFVKNNIFSAKVYLSGQEPLDFNVFEAVARGVPGVYPDEQWVNEFITTGDQTFKWGTGGWVGATKRCLRDAGTKGQSSKYTNMSTFNDKIRDALAKKPTTQDVFLPSRPTTPPQVVGRKRSGPTTAHARPTRPQPGTTTKVPPVSERTIYVSGSCVGISGYDNLVFETIKGLRSVDVDVRINANNDIRYEICPEWFRDIHMGLLPHAWEIIITPPCNFHFSVPNKRSVVLTMWETDHLEPAWVDQLNKAHLVCVPSKWGVECFRKSGVKVPMTCVPLGYDPFIFNPSHDFPKVCTFGTAAALTAGGLRKNTKFIIDLFRQAFPTQDDVRLKVKISPNCDLPTCDDPRVEIVRAMLKPLELANWYRSLTAFVNGSFAEGFGLHLIEAMACGRPLVSTHYSAVTEYFDEEVGWIADHEIVRAGGGAYTGHWGKPVGESVIEKMREVYDNPDAVRTKGESAYLRSRNYTWKEFGKNLSNALKEYGVIR